MASGAGTPLAGGAGVLAAQAVAAHTASQSSPVRDAQARALRAHIGPPSPSPLSARTSLGSGFLHARVLLAVEAQHGELAVDHGAQAHGSLPHAYQRGHGRLRV